LKHIDGHSIYNLFISGANNLIYSEKFLNSINVFPVADGDTGTNLALTMKSIVFKSIKHQSVYESLNSISQVAIQNAYGNSGMIFAQYLNGFAIESREKEKLTISEFIAIAEKAAFYAYQAVANPKEGTILSVMKGWANELKQDINNSDFEVLLENSVKKAKGLVEKTKSQLKVLMENDVVDAGAKGFLTFIEGLLEFTKNGVSIPITKSQNNEIEKHINILSNFEIEKNRYCTQFYIETKKPAQFFKNYLKELGDSLVVAGDDGHIQIHIHTDYPEKVMACLVNEERIISQKIEDMRLSSAIIHKRKNSIALVTDSIADIPRQFIDDEQISVIPINLICNSVVYQDKITMTHELFYSKMTDDKMTSTTAQPSCIVFEKVFSNLINYYDSIIGIFVSKQMSGTFENAKRVAKSLQSENKQISVIDSKLNSSAQGLLVMKAAELINKGLSHNEIVEILNKKRNDINIYVSIKDLSNMLKGGRISKTKGIILSKIKLKPVVSIDENGKGIVYKKTFSQKSAISKIINKMSDDIKQKGIENYSIVYSNSKDDIKAFEQSLINLTGMKPMFVEQISPVIGLNSGLGSFAVAYIKKGDGFYDN
jgi:DegV family protein with EDD domain